MVAPSSYNQPGRFAEIHDFSVLNTRFFDKEAPHKWEHIFVSRHKADANLSCSSAFLRRDENHKIDDCIPANRHTAVNLARQK